MSDRNETNELLEAMARAHFERDAGAWNDHWDDLSDDDKAPFIEDMRAALTALHGQGYAVVPVGPTNEMITEGFVEGRLEGSDWDYRAIYRAMCAASPIKPDRTGEA